MFASGDRKQAPKPEGNLSERDHGQMAYFSAADVIKALYQIFLSRDPDEAGLRAMLTLANDKNGDVTTIIESLLGSYEFACGFSDFVERHMESNVLRFSNSHSEYGETDHIIRKWLNRSAAYKIVVDVGARGRRLSNSYDLLRFFGWRGILIEANPRLIESISGEFCGLDAEIINCAISDYTGRATFNIADNDDVSSLNEHWAKVVDQVEVQVERLGDLLRARGIPDDFDLLSLDVEGEDIKVLNDTVSVYGYYPRWIIIEASYNFKTKSLEDLPISEVIKSRYTISGQTPSNLILEAK